MPENFHLSISKLISDHFEMATAQVSFQIKLSIRSIRLVHDYLFENYTKIDYGIDYFHMMETTRLLGAPQLAHQPHQWPVWHQARGQVLIVREIV